MSNSRISVKFESFEGPLDLLLHLVNSYKVDIFEVPLVSIIEQYIDYISALQALNLEIAGEYMLMASQLLLLKSRKLLPVVEEVDNSVEDSDLLEENLLAQIIEYKKYKEASDQLQQMHASRATNFSKPRSELKASETKLLHTASSIDLFLAFSQVLRQRQLDLRVNKASIEPEAFTVEEKLLEITETLKKKAILEFDHLFHQATSKEEAVTLFLALLELIKSDSVKIEQNGNFGSITIEKGNAYAKNHL